MKVIAFNGSPRASGNTYHLLKLVLAELEKEGIYTKLIQLGAKSFNGCTACYGCFNTKNQHCSLAFKDDPVNAYIDEMLGADGIILGSPVYCSDVTANMRALIERASLVAKANNDMFKRKIGASVVAVRRCGASTAFSSMNYFFLISQMIVIGSSYWNQGIGLEPGDVLKDDEGVRTMVNLGKNMAWALKKLI